MKKKPEVGPERSHVAPESLYLGLDPGIRFAVRVLHAHGYETCQSCQGGVGHSYPVPTIDLPTAVNDARGFGALSVLADYGLEPMSLAQVWNLDRLGRPYETVWRIELRRHWTERADQKPTFAWSYRAQ
jgi:hypothetical protein